MHFFVWKFFFGGIHLENYTAFPYWEVDLIIFFDISREISSRPSALFQ